MHPADAFLAALGKDRATFQTFLDDKSAPDRPAILHGPRAAHTRALDRLNAAGHGIFVMVNDGDLQGRRAENVQAIAAYFVDLDGTPMPDTWPAEPTITVESSPGRYHAYWRVSDEPDLALFPHVQKHLALLLDSDPVVHDLPRVMRLPGYQHRKREPFTTRILTATGAAYTHAEFADAIALPDPPPPVRPLPPAARHYVDQHKRRRGPDTEHPLDGVMRRIREAREGTRNDTLFRMASAAANDVAAGRIPKPDAEQQLLEAATSIGLSDFEARRTIQSAMRYAQ